MTTTVLAPPVTTARAGSGLARTALVFAWLVSPVGFILGIVTVCTVDRTVNPHGFRRGWDAIYLSVALELLDLAILDGKFSPMPFILPLALVAFVGILTHRGDREANAAKAAAKEIAAIAARVNTRA